MGNDDKHIKSESKADLIERATNKNCKMSALISEKGILINEGNNASLSSWNFYRKLSK